VNVLLKIHNEILLLDLFLLNFLHRFEIKILNDNRDLVMHLHRIHLNVIKIILRNLGIGLTLGRDCLSEFVLNILDYLYLFLLLCVLL
jgi:hypothetical protein